MNHEDELQRVRKAVREMIKRDLATPATFEESVLQFQNMLESERNKCMSIASNTEQQVKRFAGQAEGMNSAISQIQTLLVQDPDFDEPTKAKLSRKIQQLELEKQQSLNKAKEMEQEFRRQIGRAEGYVAAKPMITTVFEQYIALDIKNEELIARDREEQKEREEEARKEAQRLDAESQKVSESIAPPSESAPAKKKRK